MNEERRPLERPSTAFERPPDNVYVVSTEDSSTLPRSEVEHHVTPAIGWLRLAIRDQKPLNVNHVQPLRTGRHGRSPPDRCVAG